MATYAVGGSQSTISSSYKGVTVTWSGATTRRHKWYEFVLGATANPNATDTYVQCDISRLTGTTSLAGTAFTPVASDGADQAAVVAAASNLTTEVNAALVGGSLFNTGINQRATTRWIAAQESQYLIAPATAQNGIELRAQSSTYASSFAGQVSVME
jgi:hypothetical protein